MLPYIINRFDRLPPPTAQEKEGAPPHERAAGAPSGPSGGPVAPSTKSAIRDRIERRQGRRRKLSEAGIGSLGGFYEESDRAETESEGLDDDRLERRERRERERWRDAEQRVAEIAAPPDYVELSETWDDQIGHTLDLRDRPRRRRKIRGSSDSFPTSDTDFHVSTWELDTKTSSWDCEVCGQHWELGGPLVCSFCDEKRPERGEGPRHNKDPNPYPHRSKTWHYTTALGLLERILEKNFTSLDLDIPAVDSEILMRKSNVETGSCGMGYLFLRLACHPWFSEDRVLFLEQAAELLVYGQEVWSKVVRDEDRMKEAGTGFWGGLCGRIYVETLYHLETSNFREVESCVATLTSVARFAATDLCPFDDWIFGRSGLLFALIDLQNRLSGLNIGFSLDNLIVEIARKIWWSGKELVEENNIKRVPLMWAYGNYNQPFLGMKKGIMGVLYSLLCVPVQMMDQVDRDWRNELRRVIDFVRSHGIHSEAPEKSNATAYAQEARIGAPLAPKTKVWDTKDPILKNGKSWGPKPSKYELTPMPALFYTLGPEPSSSDPEPTHKRTNQNWADGAGGALFLFLKARSVLGDEGDRLLEASRNCADELWSTGLVRTGLGLCEGISGNVYAFWRLARVESQLGETRRSTNLLERARLFAAFATHCESELPKSMRIKSLLFSRTDRFGREDPSCMMHGYAGALLMLLDLENPTNARFPLFEPTLWASSFDSNRRPPAKTSRQ